MVLPQLSNYYILNAIYPTQTQKKIITATKNAVTLTKLKHENLYTDKKKGGATKLDCPITIILI